MNDRAILELCESVKNNLIGWAGARGASYPFIVKALLNSQGDHVEIGSLFGGSAIVAAKALNTFSEHKVYCVDPMLYDEQEPYIVKDLKRPKSDVLLFKNQQMVFQDNIWKAKVTDTVKLVRARSQPWPFSSDKEFATAFVDGWHYGDTPLRDVETLADIVTRDIIVDDVVESYPAVYRAFQYLANHPDWYLRQKHGRMAWFTRWDHSVKSWEFRVG